METFMQQLRSGQVAVSSIDDFIDQWHNGTSALSLVEFLGMTSAEYQDWLTDPTSLALTLEEPTTLTLSSSSRYPSSRTGEDTGRID